MLTWGPGRECTQLSGQIQRRPYHEGSVLCVNDMPIMITIQRRGKDGFRETEALTVVRGLAVSRPARPSPGCSPGHSFSVGSKTRTQVVLCCFRTALSLPALCICPQ